ncbi:HEPN domain-containing protein [Candidatus Woesearchaeota archaeon]|nr:HEPN domain-containing protein [Candidatus Woesearchaeota archaeon]
MPKNKSRLEWCLASEDRLKRIPLNNLKAKEHIEKAKHNLLAADYNVKGNFNDWAVSQAYYAMYHSLLAILYKFGYESKNHECTISAVEHLIETKKIGLDIKDIAFIRTTEQMKMQDAKSLREEFQYGTKTDVNKEILNNLINRAKEIVEKIEIALQGELKA